MAFYLFLVSWFSHPELVFPCGLLALFFGLHFHSQNLPEPYTSITPIRTLYQTQKNEQVSHLTESDTKKEENHAAFSLFLCDLVSAAMVFQCLDLFSYDCSPQPEPSRGLQPNQRQKRNHHSQILPEAYISLRYNKKRDHLAFYLFPSDLTPQSNQKEHEKP